MSRSLPSSHPGFTRQGWDYGSASACDPLWTDTHESMNPNPSSSLSRQKGWLFFDGSTQMRNASLETRHHVYIAHPRGIRQCWLFKWQSWGETKTIGTWKESKSHSIWYVSLPFYFYGYTLIWAKLTLYQRTKASTSNPWGLRPSYGAGARLGRSRPEWKCRLKEDCRLYARAARWKKKVGKEDRRIGRSGRRWNEAMSERLGKGEMSPIGDFDTPIVDGSKTFGCRPLHNEANHARWHQLHTQVKIPVVNAGSIRIC
jgi:hypothetical protein